MSSDLPKRVSQTKKMKGIKTYPVKSCGKITYPTLNKAVESALVQISKGMDAICPYPCPGCGGFHLGHGTKKWERRFKRQWKLQQTKP